MTSPPNPAPKKNRTLLWINLAVVAVLVIAVGVVLLVLGLGSSNGSNTAAPGEGTAAAGGSPTPGETDAATSTVGEDPNILGEPGDTDVVLVEFLDFECPACAALHPFIDSMRDEYAGDVTFIVRYFPIESHANGTTSAVAAEAAANQGEFEAMYERLFETQELWAGQQESMAPVFRGYAEAMGLDMAQYDADVDDPATLERVIADQADGVALGVAGTPTFFLNDELLQPETYDDFAASLDEALGR